MALEPGSRFGRYLIGDPIGAGGMGQVYQGTDTELDRAVAIKVLPDSFAADAERVGRFEAEAKTLAALNHPNIAQIYGLERSDGLTALVMELIEGQTLAERLERGALPVNEAMGIAQQIADALEAAHGRKIVHRDLKPANIKLTPQGVVKVLDFGIAKVLDLKSISSDPEASFVTPSVTQTGVLLGTAAYMSPEQARGRPVDERSDIFAFGAVLYEMLTGQPAFGGEDVAVTLARVLERNTDMETLPALISPAVRQTLRLCLQKNPSKRIADIRDVRLALAGEFETTTSAAPPPSRLQRVGPIAAGLVVGGVLFGALGWVMREPQPAAEPVSRLLLMPPEDAPLASVGGWDAMISPDGSQIVYLAQIEGSNQVELWLRDLDTLEPRRITGTAMDTTGGSMLPFYSPDGANVGYRSPGDGLMRVALAGGPPLNVLPDNVIESPQYLGAAWASDGTIIYSSGAALHRVSSGGGGTPVRLTPEPENPGTRLIAPDLLPGEKALLYTLDNNIIMVLDLETGESRQLINPGKNAFYVESGHIVFARDTTLLAVAFDVATLTTLGDPVALTEGVRYPGGGTGTDFAVSDSGTLIYVPAREAVSAGRQIAWVRPNGEIEAPVSAELFDNARSQRLSPDGTRLAVTAGPAGVTEAEVWILDLEGRPSYPLVPEGGTISPVWSPDGGRIAARYGGSDALGIHILPAGGAVAVGQPLPGSANLIPYNWTAEDVLLAIDLTAVPNIVAMNLDDPEAGWRPVVATPSFREIDPALSPDGRWLAYASDRARSGEMEIWIQAWPDGEPQRVSRNGGGEPVWSADGRELYFIQGQTVYVQPVAENAARIDGSATELFSGPFFPIPAGNPIATTYDVADDGRFVMLLAGGASAGPDRGQDSVVVVQNFDEELRQRVPVP